MCWVVWLFVLLMLRCRQSLDEAKDGSLVGARRRGDRVLVVGELPAKSQSA